MRLEAGDAVLWANAEVGTGISFGRRVMLRLPRKAIAPAVAISARGSCAAIPRETEGLRLLRQYLRRDAGPGSRDPRSAAADRRSLHDLMALTLGATGDAAFVAEDRGVRAARLRAVKDDVARNLTKATCRLTPLRRATRSRRAICGIVRAREHDILGIRA